MKLNPDQLSRQFNSPPLPVYLVSGDEPLLVQEAADAIRANARSNGFSEREVFHVDSGFGWESLLDISNSLSLFAEKRIIELRLSGNPGKAGSEILQHCLANPHPDNLYLIIMPKLDASAQKSAWFKAIDKVGATLALWPVEFERLPGWITQRCRQRDINITDDAAYLLAERIEGNLLAAVQEIEKLKLLYPNQEINSAAILGGVADSARHDVFSLIDSALQGKQERSLKIIHGLRAEHSEPAIILWALSREIRMLTQLSQSHGAQREALMKKNRIWGKRKGLVDHAIRQVNPVLLQRLLVRCARADQSIKGLNHHDSWQLLSDITLALASQCRR